MALVTVGGVIAVGVAFSGILVMVVPEASAVTMTSSLEIGAAMAAFLVTMGISVATIVASLVVFVAASVEIEWISLVEVVAIVVLEALVVIAASSRVIASWAMLAAAQMLSATTVILFTKPPSRVGSLSG